MIRINLLPVKTTRKKELLIGQLVILAAVVILAVGACGGAYVTMLAKINSEKEQIAAYEAEINRLRKTLGEVAQFKKMQEELRGKLDVLAQLKAGKTGPVHLLDKLSLALPERVWLTSFKETGGSISISGFGMNEEVVAQFLRDLEASPYYRNVELQLIEQVLQGGSRVNKFDIVCRADSPRQDVAGTRGAR
jgi:type IV pilus assembly protein PilN